MTSVVIWRYRENKIKWTWAFKGGGGCRWCCGRPSQDNGRGNTALIHFFLLSAFLFTLFETTFCFCLWVVSWFPKYSLCLSLYEFQTCSDKLDCWWLYVLERSHVLALLIWDGFESGQHRFMLSSTFLIWCLCADNISSPRSCRPAWVRRALSHFLALVRLNFALMQNLICIVFQTAHFIHL